MEFRNLVARNRSYRRFDSTRSIDPEVLEELIDLARCTASGGNQQPIKYILSCHPDWNAKIFSTLSWAGFLKDWPGPAEGQRPTAYIVFLYDSRIRDSAPIDVGIAAQTILLGAAEKGLGGCLFGSIRREDLGRSFDLPDFLDIALVMALGTPVETVVIENAEPGGSIKYWRDDDQIHHVPKRTRKELVHKIYN